MKLCFSSSFKQISIFTLRVMSIAFLALGCDPKKEKNQGGSSATQTATATATISKTSATPIMNRYCSDVNSVKLRTDIAQEIKYFCNNNSPTSAMLDLVKAVHESPEGRATIKIVEAKHGNDQWSEFLIVWGFKVPTTPIALKDRPIYDLIAKGTTTANLELSASAVRQPDETVDHALHIWSASLAYDLLILGSNNLRIPTKRNTQYNLYQIRPGVEDMGLGVEHLVDSQNEDYKLATMINVAFKNEVQGESGSVNLALSHIKIYNRGFPSTAETAMKEISGFLADTMFKALK